MPAVAEAAALTVENLRVRRGGREVLHGLSVEVERGSVTGLLGPSGCGKSTLMRAIVGVQIVAQRHRHRAGPPRGRPRPAARVGYVTQAPSVYADITVQENLRYFASIVGADHDRIARTTAIVGLAGHEHQLVGSLSGGERSRVSLATALLNRPELLVLDEPTVGLDPLLRNELWGAFHELAREGTTLLISSHVMDEASECDRLLLMRDGELLLEQSTPEELRRSTGENDLSQAFLSVIRRSQVARDLPAGGG